MDRSPGFGSTPQDLTPYSDSLSLRIRSLKLLILALQSNSPAHYAKGMPSGWQSHSPRTDCRRTVSGSISLPSTGVLFTFPSRYWFTIGRWRVFSLGGWSPQIRSGFHVSRPTWERLKGSFYSFRLRGFHPLWRGIPTTSAKNRKNPGLCAPDHTAVPLPPIRNGCAL